MIVKLYRFDTVESKAKDILPLLAFAVNPDPKLIVEARKELEKLMTREAWGIKKEGLTLAEVAHTGLLVLAELSPINDKDPISQDTIEADDRVVISTGHQFSLTSLIAYHNARDYRGSQLGEQHNSKWLLNPLTNRPIEPMDVEHIKKMALRKQLRIEDLKTTVNVPVPVPELVMPADLAAQNVYGNPPNFQFLQTINVGNERSDRVNLAELFRRIPRDALPLNLASEQAVPERDLRPGPLLDIIYDGHGDHHAVAPPQAQIPQANPVIDETAAAMAVLAAEALAAHPGRYGFFEGARVANPPLNADLVNNERDSALTPPEGPFFPLD